MVSPMVRRNNRRRSAKGSIIAGFAVELAIGTAVAIVFTFMLLDCGIHALYREKIAYVTAHGAMYAAAYTGSNLKTATKQAIAAQCETMGLPVQSLSVQVAETTTNGQESVVCTVHAVLPLLKGLAFPATVNVSDTSVALVKGNSPANIMMVNILGIGNIVNADSKVKLVSNK